MLELTDEAGTATCCSLVESDSAWSIVRMRWALSSSKSCSGVML